MSSKAAKKKTIPELTEEQRNLILVTAHLVPELTPEALCHNASGPDCDDITPDQLDQMSDDMWIQWGRCCRLTESGEKKAQAIIDGDRVLRTAVFVVYRGLLKEKDTRIDELKKRIEELGDINENLHEQIKEQSTLMREVENKIGTMRQNRDGSNLYVAKDGSGGRKCYIVAANMKEAVAKIEAWGVEEFSIKKVCNSENFLLGDGGE